MIARLGFRDKDVKALHRLECLEIDVLVHVVEDEESFLVLKNGKQHADYRSDTSYLDLACVYCPIAQAFDNAQDLCTESVALFSTVSPIPNLKTTAGVHGLLLQKPSSKR